MIRVATIRELFSHDDWAHGKLLAMADALPDASLDQPFEMGEGSLRRTLNHLWAAERVWLDRWKRAAKPHYRADPAGSSVAQLRDEIRRTAAERSEFLASASDANLASPLTYTNTKGESYTFKLGDLMLHVCNHGVHHRAQAVNMLKRVGGGQFTRGPDYIFMKLEEPGGGTREATPPTVDLETIKAYLAYADWARDRTHAAAAKLSDEQLDREFPIGLGTLRKTLLHIRFAEQWWLENWTMGPGRPFPETSESTSIAELARLFDQTTRERKAFIASLTDADLSRFVEARPRPDLVRAFTLGVTMLQLCCHGTHHRAQALNMLRHNGGDVPGLDVVTMLRAG